MQYQADSSFDADLFAFLEQWEGVVYTPYNDVGNIAIGIGYNLTTGDPALRTGVLTQMGLKVAADPNSSNTAEQAEANFISQLNGILGAGYTASSKQDLDNIMAERANKAASDSAFAAYIGTSTPRNSFSFTNNGDNSLNQTGLNEMQAVFSLAIPHYQNIVFDKLGITQQTAPAGFVGSKEEEALLSLAWNGAVLITPGLVNAVKSGNRAEAWFEIRYVSNYVGRDYSLGHALTSKEQNLWNSNFDKGWAKRRYAEADLFGLYDDPNNVSATEAKDIYRMFTIHRDQISAYENTYGVAFDGSPATLRGDNLGASPDILAALAPAFAAVLQDLSTNSDIDVATAYSRWAADGTTLDNINATDVFIDPGRDSSSPSLALAAVNPDHFATLDATQVADSAILIGEGDSVTGGGGDVLKAGSGNDLMIGGAGNDTFYGGAGNDYMAGGAGDDVYNIKNGSTVTIEDTQGANTLLIDGKSFGYFYTADGTNFYTDNQNITAVSSNGDFIINDSTTGTQVTLNQNFQSGDFGITLVIDQAITPSGVTPDNTINGDLNPINYGTTTNPIYHYDSLGNVITDGTASPNYDDALYGSSLNDSISTGGGTNVVYADQGGNDTINGGSGNDWITASNGANLIIGNGGQDVIVAGSGDNQIYADTQVSIATALDQRKNATATGSKGDLIAVGNGDTTAAGGNNTIVGGNGNDLIFTGGGNDTLISGSQRMAANDVEWRAIA